MERHFFKFKIERVTLLFSINMLTSWLESLSGMKSVHHLAKMNVLCKFNI